MSSTTLGRYQIIREIARSNDIVYEAVDPAIGRRIALKELQLPPNLVGSAKRERIERFYREAKAAGSLTHPNIVTIFEVGEDAGRHFIAMEFLEGQTLQDVIEIRGSIPPKEAADIMAQVLDALQYAHTKGVIHRDIKPANIQLLPGGVVKLTDFGIARIMHEASITQNGQIFGTPSYMSPEQVAGKEIDPRSDVFSAGVVLYEALTGSKPFTGDSVVTITYNIMNTPAIRPQGIPERLADIVEKALAKDPGQRFSSAGEFASALRSDWTLPSQPVNAPPPPIFFPQGTPPPTPAPTSTGHVPGLPPPLPPLPQRPANTGPLISPGMAAFLKTVAISLALGISLLMAFLGVGKAWQSYVQRANDERAAVFVQEGNSRQSAGDYRGAIDRYKKALTLDVSGDFKIKVKEAIASCYTNIGIQYINTGNPSGAVRELQQALSYAPDSGDALYIMGVAYERMGRWAEAADFWQQAIIKDPNSEGGRQAVESLQDYYFSIAQQQMLNGNIDSALDYYRKVVEIDAGSDYAIAAQKQIDILTMIR